MKLLCPRLWCAKICTVFLTSLVLAAGPANAAPPAPAPNVTAVETAPANDPVGDWFTIHDETHKATSVVRLGWEGDTLVGRVVRVIDSPRGPNPLCDKCSGARRGKPIVGLDILGGLRGKDGVYEGGYVIDPSNGKEYRAKVRMRGRNVLELRGYLGISVFGRTQIWQRVPSDTATAAERGA